MTNDQIYHINETGAPGEDQVWDSIYIDEAKSLLKDAEGFLDYGEQSFVEDTYGGMHGIIIGYYPPQQDNIPGIFIPDSRLSDFESKDFKDLDNLMLDIWLYKYSIKYELSREDIKDIKDSILGVTDEYGVKDIIDKLEKSVWWNFHIYENIQTKEKMEYSINYVLLARIPRLILPEINKKITIMILDRPKSSGEKTISCKCEIYGMEGIFRLYFHKTIYTSMLVNLKKKEISIDDKLKCIVGRIFTIKGIPYGKRKIFDIYIRDDLENIDKGDKEKMQDTIDRELQEGKDTIEKCKRELEIYERINDDLRT